ncbi:uncharacterized protein LOC126685707 isoform X2 [Mercurialis annua]|uniref:uncharacterized protein LOC126685707 isoform X2 n=1 Tax=Mercurialis annua TaxID=3986 RepID=UPI0024AC8E86|nr:uncharacterized protein LOC126685707 isoform X2 [Mercurialis annua]
MGLAGRFICSMTGIDSLGGFDPNLEAFIQGLGYASPPIMASLFILYDEVVKLSPHARAIRDVEDEELRSFFYGMSPCICRNYEVSSMECHLVYIDCSCKFCGRRAFLSGCNSVFLERDGCSSSA